ncbi:hypothetical protein SUGI_0318220 [Cryptomeria japonica]|uniref:uncharacterized protein LOC131047147 n=1 Tax=Cryptomeria japonica TaxID=3369 RepID=UPI002408AEF7|nr:uncharacterized protein LOC131047147 [Cryptomeria japonica]GLJ18033.1 hypothetical protein SUGI_0318220 [Cryptomeria japonica]
MKEHNRSNNNGENVHFHVLKVRGKVGKGSNKRNNTTTQTPVYTIHKSEFRNTVQMLTGSQSPSNNVNQTSKQILNEPSRLRQIRPPPLFGPNPFARDSNPGPLPPTNGNSLTPISMQFPFPSAIDSFWANLAVNSRQQTQNLSAAQAPSMWGDNVLSLDRSSVPSFPSPGSRCLPSPSFLSPLPSPSGLPKDFYSLSPSSYPHGHM